MKFKISSALKDHIGKELITDDNVAIFEIVKNSYDAGAKKVKIVFKDMRSQQRKIYVIDDGKGMSEEDLENKWLFVGYSEKKDFENLLKKGNKSKRFLAGAKGIGRFSCDRLGSKLKIYTRTKHEKNYNVLELDWKKFEEDQKKEFMSIEVEISKARSLKFDFGEFKNPGTIIEISDLRDEWEWEDLQKTKRYLQRLINPLQVPNEDDFSIEIIAEDFKIDDAKQKYDYGKVSGRVQNPVYEKLGLKTTTIDCKISEDGKEIITSLNDKGIPIFSLKEKNKNFPLLKNINIKCSYLNAVAKAHFKKIMGEDIIRYGNIFVFKNGFRILPYGESGDDWLELNLRKSQGHNRYLGTRELIGRIEINGYQEELKETTSRAEGLVKTRTFFQLKNFFMEKIIRVLERYVVDAIDWGREKDFEDIKKDSRKMIDRITGSSKDKELIYVNEDLLEIVEDKTIRKIPKIIKNIEYISKKEPDQEIKKLYSQQVRSLKLGLKLQKKKEKEKTKKYEEEIEEKEEEIKEEKEKTKKVGTENVFLKSISSQDKDQLISLFHHIGIHSHTIKSNVGNLFKILKEIKQVPEKAYSQLSDIAKVSQMINTISKIGYKGGITKEMEKGKQDIIEFIEEFITNICIPYYSGITAKINNSLSSKVVKEFIPFELTYVIDNFISNSKKANATEISFNFLKEKDKSTLEVIDNGDGLSSKIKRRNEIFERTVSTTRGGAGLGLYDAKKIINKIGGKINAPEVDGGFKIKIIF